MAEPGLVMKANSLPPVSKAKLFVQKFEPLQTSDSQIYTFPDAAEEVSAP